MPADETFGARLRRMMEARLLTLEEVARRANEFRRGVCTVFAAKRLSLLELDRVSPTVNEILPLARALGCTTDELLGMPPRARPACVHCGGWLFTDGQCAECGRAPPEHPNLAKLRRELAGIAVAPVGPLGGIDDDAIRFLRSLLGKEGREDG